MKSEKRTLESSPSWIPKPNEKVKYKGLICSVDFINLGGKCTLIQLDCGKKKKFTDVDLSEIEEIRTEEEMKEYLKNTYHDGLFYWDSPLPVKRRYDIAKWYMTLTKEQKSMISDIRHETSLDTEFGLSEGA